MTIDSLVSRIQAAKEAYYNGSAPLMSDAQYDACEDELRKLAPEHPLLKQIGAPVPGASGWTKVRHGQRMSSLNKAQTLDEFKAWWASVGKGPLFVTEKLDGASISLRYEQGVLVQALTRGDGELGEDITRNVLMMKGFPKSLFTNLSFTGHVRGEIICKKSDHKIHFPEDSNPRNTASGTAKRQSDPEPCRHLTVVSYQWVPEGELLPTKEAELALLEVSGFTVPNHYVGQNDLWAESIYNQYVKTSRDALDYDIDGLVFEINNSQARESWGDLGDRPKAAVAFKFPHAEKQTTLRNVRWQVGNSGRVTPVAVFDVVDLAGAKVEKASLHNVSFYQEVARQIRPSNPILFGGDTILCSRRNDVIPFVEAGIKAAQTESTPLTIPTVCPDCGFGLVMEGEYLVCNNGVSCPSQKAGAVKRWLAKLGVLGWGDAIIEGLCEKKIIHDPADLYFLTYEQLASLELSGRVVGSTATMLLENLKAKTELDLHLLVGSLGIPLCARSVCKTIVDAGYDTLGKMATVKIAELSRIPGMGEAKAEAFVSGIEQRKAMIDKLLKVIKIKGPSTGGLKGMSVCFTGFRSRELEEAIENQGGTIKSSVSKGLTYLVTKDPSSTSGKAEKARAYGTQIVGVDEMWKLLGK